MTKQTKHQITTAELDRLIQIAGQLDPTSRQHRLLDADLIAKCKAIQPGDVVEVESHGSVGR